MQLGTDVEGPATSLVPPRAREHAVRAIACGERAAPCRGDSSDRSRSGQAPPSEGEKTRGRKGGQIASVRQAVANRDDGIRGILAVAAANGPWLSDRRADREPPRPRFKVSEANYQGGADTVHSLNRACRIDAGGARRTSWRRRIWPRGDQPARSSRLVSHRPRPAGDSSGEHAGRQPSPRMSPLKLKTAYPLKACQPAEVQAGQTVAVRPHVEAFLNRGSRQDRLVSRLRRSGRHAPSIGRVALRS